MLLKWWKGVPSCNDDPIQYTSLTGGWEYFKGGHLSISVIDQSKFTEN